MNLASVTQNTKAKLMALGIKAKSKRKIEDGKGLCLTLCRSPVTSEAKAATTALAECIGKALGGQRALAKRVAAVGALLSDLLKVLDAGAGAYAYRSMRNDSFTSEAVGRTSFHWSLDGMERLGLVTVVKADRGPAHRSDGIATRLYPRPALRQLAEDAGIEPGQWASHFKAKDGAVPPLVMARAGATGAAMTEKGYRPRVQGRRVPVDDDHPAIISDKARLTIINERLAAANITPVGMFSGLTRIYSNANLPDHDYRHGGRLYDLRGRYQQIKSEFRAKILFNGEPCVELDLSASHFTVYRALIGQLVDPSIDAYSIPGMDREVAKLFFCTSFGSGKFPERWSSDNRKAYASKTGGRDLSKDCSVKRAKELVLTKYPFMADWPKSPTRWGRLQYEESCIILDAVEQLILQYDCPALPVHDSLIVPKSMENIAKIVLCACFEERLGCTPALKVK